MHITATFLIGKENSLIFKQDAAKFNNLAKILRS
jgi:hypothetical protein